MFGFIRVLKFCAGVMVTTLMLVGAPTQSRAQAGVININIVKVGFILGVGGGSGTFYLQRQCISHNCWRG